MARRTLLVGTQGGAFKVDLNGGQPAVTPLGLERVGGLRCPIVVDCDNPRVLFAGTVAMGVLRSDDAGQSWQPTNNGLNKPEVWWLEQHPLTGELWAGTSPAAMFKSDDRGEHWRECEQVQALPRVPEWTFPNPPHIPHVKHISLRADDPLDILAAVEEGWLIRSRDGGATWANLTEGTEFDSHTAYFMPHTDAQVIVSTSGSGVYRSDNGGAWFSASDAGLDRRYMAHLVVNEARPERVFTAAAAVPPPGWSRPEGARSAVYRSTDQARSWTRLGGGLPEDLSAAPRAVAGDPADPNVVCIGLTDGAVWLTEDAGDSFRPVVQMPTQQERGRPSGVTSLRVLQD